MWSSTSNTKTSPLVSHRFGYTRESYASYLASVHTGYHVEEARLEAFGHILSRSQQGQVPKPQVCLLLLRVAKLPGMNHLVWQSNARAYETHRVLNADIVYRRSH